MREIIHPNILSSLEALLLSDNKTSFQSHTKPRTAENALGNSELSRVHATTSLSSILSLDISTELTVTPTNMAFGSSQGVTSTETAHTNTTMAPIIEPHFCKYILYREIGSSRVRIWDLAILIPNVVFLLLLAVRFNRARLRLRATSSPIFSTFYALVIMNATISVIRCIVSMTVNAAVTAGDLTDKILWVAVRFFLLSTELSVVIFGLAFGHLDSKTSIRRVLLFTSLISLAYSITQGALEIVAPDENFYKENSFYGLFGHGGMLFWFVSSIIFTVVYVAIFILPWTRLRERLALPSKRSFYYYTLFLALLNMVQAVGSGLLYYKFKEGLCIVDVTTYIYFTFFTPLVYRTFLSDFFGISQPSIMFSYKVQVDEVVEDDTVSLPHQLSCSSLKTDSDYIYQNNSLYDSTQFDAATPVNPLYAHSLQSPDSMNGYNMSRSNSINSDPGYQQGSGSFIPQGSVEK